MESPKSGIVTGAASGLGRAISLELARKGWRIAIADINEAEARETLKLVEAAGGQGQVERLDVSDAQAWIDLRTRLQASWPRLDLLVNNAGVAIGGTFENSPLEDWRWIMNINLFGPIYGCHALVEWMKNNPHGAHIVNVCSLAAIACPHGTGAYNVTKGGLLAFTETLYTELRPWNISVSAVCPSFVPTNIGKVAKYQNEVDRAMIYHLLDASRVTADDVARKVVRAIERKRLYVFVPLFANIVWRLKRLWPTLALKLAARERDKLTARFSAQAAAEAAAKAASAPK